METFACLLEKDRPRNRESSAVVEEEKQDVNWNRNPGWDPNNVVNPRFYFMY